VLAFAGAKYSIRQLSLQVPSVVIWFTLRSRNPVERLVRDAVLSEEEAQMGRVFLDVAQIVHL